MLKSSSILPLKHIMAHPCQAGYDFHMMCVFLHSKSVEKNENQEKKTKVWVEQKQKKKSCKNSGRLMSSISI